MSFTKLHRQFLSWEWYDDGPTMRVFIHMVLHAKYKDDSWRGIELKRGQLRVTIKDIASDLRLGEQQIKRAIKNLKKTGEITTQSIRQATKKGTIVTLCNYETYNKIEKESNQETTDKQPTNNQEATDKQPTSNQAIIKEVKKERKKEPFYASGFGLPVALGDREPLFTEFVSAYTENGGGIHLNPSKVRQAMAPKGFDELRKIIDAIPTSAALCKERCDSIPCGSKFISEDLWTVKATPEQLKTKAERTKPEGEDEIKIL